MNDFPFITEHLPGIGGTIKDEPEDFFVEEIPSYEPLGIGEHVYLFVEKKNLSTQELIQVASETFQVPAGTIGLAGLKDKFAVTRQRISVPRINEQDAYKIEKDERIKVLWARRHKNKLRVGHLRGNKFRIIVRHARADGFEIAQSILDELKRKGLPNYFGKQRFSNKANVLLGRKLIRSNKRYNWGKNKFAIEVYQSYLFNQYLAERIRRRWFDVLLTGDVAIRHATGGLFIVEDDAKELSRFESFEISPTGPIFGYDMPGAKTQMSSDPHRLEEEVLGREGLSFQMLEDMRLKRAKIYGARRATRIPITDVNLERSNQELALEFFLPKGSYATVLLREVMKTASDQVLPCF